MSVHTSPSLVLILQDQLSANNPIIGWHNLVTAGGVTATSSLADYPASNLGNPSTAERWESDSTSEQYLTFDVTTDDEVDYVAVARHNWGSGEITFSVERYDDDEEDWIEIFEETMPGGDGPLIARFEPVALAQIRIRLQPGTVKPRAAVVYVGKLLVLQRRIYVGHTPLPYGRSARIQTNESESGEFLGRVVLSEKLETRVSLQNLTPTWYRANLAPFIAASKETPFFFAWRPEDYPDEAGYAWMTNNPQPVNQRSNGMMQVEMQMGGVAL